MTDDSDEYSDTTRAVVDELDHGSVIDDKLIVSKSKARKVVFGTATLAGVLGLGVGNVAGQSDAAKLGSESEPIDADLANYGSTSTASGYEFTIEGDTFQVNE